MNESEQFEIWWSAFPNKKGKKAARAEFMKAIKETDLKTMLDALEQYKACKPHWQDYCHPRTWLHQGRWDDEWEPEKPTALAAFSQTLDELEMRNGQHH